MIPLADLHAQHSGIRDEVEAAVIRVLRSGRYALGPEVEAFEREFAAYCGVHHAVGVNSGTSALYVALLTCGVGPEDEVITVPLTFIATVAAIRQTGARVRFVDVDPVSYTMNPALIADEITDRTKAIVPVHLYGQPADMDPILAIAHRHGIAVIEDAAQAHGATYKNRMVGGLGDLGCFSFYPAKNLGACGEGGMILTQDPERARIARMLRDWGQESQYHHVLKGGNYRLDGVQGAILRVKLQHLDKWNESRRAIAATYIERLSNSGVRTPTEMAYARHVYNVFAVLTDRRDMLRDALQSRAISVGVHYPTLVHRQPAYASLDCGETTFPCAEAVTREELSLPIYPELSDENIRRVTDSVCEALAKRSATP